MEQQRRSKMEGRKGRVCVTGGTGFIGSWLVKRLLQDGYSVNTTVRHNPEHKRDVSFLTSLPGASQRLQILSADLSNPESFSAAIEGCIGVFHVATPIDFNQREPEEVVTKRCIDGALSILKACHDSKTVKRVVYTSSVGAVICNQREEQVMDESFWSDVDYCRSSRIMKWSYAISKTLTEKAVLEFGEKNGLEVVAVNPPLVLGPFICPKLPDSISEALNLAFGIKDPLAFNHRVPMVHVEDVARAHIFLFEHPDPKGRYICSSSNVSFERIYKLVSSKYSEFQQQTADATKQNQGPRTPDLSAKKLTDAGFKFTYEPEEMLDDTIQCCKDKGYL